MKIDTYGWAPIVKAEKQEDGTLLVTGRVSDDGLDRDAQRCDAAWLDQAVPEWFAEGGNVREMHSNIAAGKALQHWKAEDGGHMVTARVVDQGSITKVENDVLTGFSIGIKGGRVTKAADAPNGRIVGGKIIEVSLVDRPANPSCMLAIAKADEATGEAVEVEQQLVVKGEALPEPEPSSMRTLPGVTDVTKDEGLPQPSSEPGEVTEVPTVKETPADTVSRVTDDVRVAARGVLDALASLDLPPWVKADDGDETADITNAQQAIAIIARLIQSEAESLAAGELSEAYDVATLLEAVSALRWFIRSEQAETVDQAVADAMVGLADTPELVKADQPTDTPTEPVTAPVEVLTEAAVLAKVEGIVAEALTKAEQVHKAELDALRTELAEVKAQPVAGGPVRVRTTQDRAKADELDTRTLLEQADAYDAKADATDDRALADGYRALARDARTKAAR